MHKGLGKRLNINTTDHSMHPEIDHMIHVISVENMAIGQINATRREEVDIPLLFVMVKMRGMSTSSMQHAGKR